MLKASLQVYIVSGLARERKKVQLTMAGDRPFVSSCRLVVVQCHRRDGTRFVWWQQSKCILWSLFALGSQEIAAKEVL